MSATIHDVARRAGVSKSTVSSVINGNKFVSPELRQRVLQAIQDLDYIPNFAGRALSSKRTSTIAYMIPTITGAFYPMVIETVESTAAKHGFGLIICNIERDVGRAQKAQAFLLGARVDGIVISPTGALPSELLVAPFKKRNIPVVLLTGPNPLAGVDSFVADNEHAAKALTRYLIGMGHKQFMFIGRKGSATTDIRLSGVTKALNDAGLSMPDHCVMRTPSVTVTYTEIVKQLLQMSPLPTAIVCQSDSIAVSAIRACYYLGLRVPEDISVTGWDDTIGDDCIPPLTTMATPVHEMGRQATESLIRRIAATDESLPTSAHWFIPELVIRASSGLPRKNPLQLT